MKPNPVHNWSITLRGAKPTQAFVSAITGTIEDALAEADVMECEVRWQVREISIVILSPARRRRRSVALSSAAPSL